MKISMNLERLEFGLPEFARLVLHYYAKILYILDPADKESALSASAMFHMMDKVIEKPIARYSNILEIADINDVMEVSIGQPENPHCRMVAKLYYIDQDLVPRKYLPTASCFFLVCLIAGSCKSMRSGMYRYSKTLANVYEYAVWPGP